MAAADERARALRLELASRKATLPLRYWRQQAHFTTPAERDIATKAMSGGTAPMPRILERFGVSPTELADHIGADSVAVEQLLSHPRPAPLVMVDAEDALAHTDAATRQARIDAIEVLSVAPATGQVAPTLRFFRPPGLELGNTARELYSLLWGLVERHGPEALPLDGIVFPKIEHPEEVDLVHDMLSAAEKALGIAEGTVRTAYLVESGWAASQLDGIAIRAADRLCALIFGLADYSADLGLTDISTDHAVADWARAHIVNVAAGVGVPAIDGMTLAYPVADAALDAAANRARFLDRMALVYSDTVRARDLGLVGKWVAHPAQLFAVLLAYDAAFSADALEREADKLAAYSQAVHGDGKGATMIDGVMSDRATDRHAREVLRRATAMGRFDAARAVALGVIDQDELAGAGVDTATTGGLR
ncbi:MAG: aldolase/citrate lyase family protein [Chloroflexota bacterium]